MKSSPHTRGAHPPHRRLRRHQRIIPAYAGSTWLTSLTGLGFADHPRIRGEHRRRPYRLRDCAGSSPHTRGAPRHADVAGRPTRIIPAYAGSTEGCVSHHSPRPDHPRIRGEHTGSASIIAVRRGSSPHTRGALGFEFVAYFYARIIPAYAGSTRARRRRCGVGRDHPRIRGEHSGRHLTPHRRHGSSPHTRGAPCAQPRTPRNSRIIPAYAGSTCRCR